ncbi:glycoside hydrolase family 104 protein [Chryseobacterium sp. FH2]|uniref:glycoside hydrolase family 24 protein n=1 Tax=Chryseobacterium sp. FH2 TaxID=1674291 RepID=UPI00065AF66D|nr:glycoside hydrolase family 104 protein [Chryseobacterium sp. FH2]
METQKRGISQITGKTEIKLGEKVYYKVSRIHRMEDHDKVKNALWKIYVKEKGTWRELKPSPSATQKKGDEVSYTITNQSLVGKELLVEAYIYEPEKTAPPGLKIKVIPGTEKKIHRVELFMVDDTPIKEDMILKYNQTIKVKVYTQNMPGELLKLTLYEDDAEGDGHSPKNEKNKVAEVTKSTNGNGFLWHEFKLSAEFSKIANAMMDGSHDKLHEYYVLVESAKYGKKASKNVEVENPDYLVHQTYENGKVTDHKTDRIYDGGVIEEVIIKGKYKKQMGFDPIPKTERSVSVVGEPPEKKEEKVCECEARVRAYMRMLRVGEGTGELIKSSKYNKETKKNEIVYISHDFEAGYTKLFGGGNFTKSPHNKNTSTHPQIKILWYTKKNGEKVYSSAAGAYQVMGYTWSDNDMINKRKTYNVKDFSPEGQDKFCVVLFKHKREGMLDLIIKGDIKGATEKYGSYEWASLPPGRYGQPIETMEKVLELYEQFYQEELAGKSPLHLKKGFLKEFGYDCCGKAISIDNSTNSSCGKSEIDLRDKITWQTQFDPKWGGRDKQLVACKKTCDDILINSGLKATSLLRVYQTAIEDDKHTKLIINTPVSKEAIIYLDSELEKGHPVQVGVDHGIGYKINNNADHSTDHFVVIIGRKCDGNKCYYLFYDVGTSHKEKGANDNNRLYFDKTDYSLKGKTVYNGHFYTVTQVRKN